MKVKILGSVWTIEERAEKEDALLVGCDGYTDWTRRLIVIEKQMQGTLGDIGKYTRKVLRHEIIHAFLFECGLAECSGHADSWAENETMVDWYARMAPKIWKVWTEAKALDQKDFV